MKSPRFKFSHRHDRGFVLLLVLLLVGAVAATATVLIQTSSSLHRSLSAEQESTRKEHALNAGLARLEAEFLSSSDELRSAAFGKGATWSFDGYQIRLLAGSEAGKVDINNAQLDLLRSAKRAFLPKSFAVATARDGEKYAEVEALLKDCARYSTDASTLRRVFTVYSGTTGLALHLARPELIDGLDILTQTQKADIRDYRADPNRLYRLAAIEGAGTYVSHGAGTVTLRAEITLNGSLQDAKERVVSLSPRKPFIHPVMERRLSQPVSFCDEHSR